jgi:hypothetical protein
MKLIIFGGRNYDNYGKVREEAIKFIHQYAPLGEVEIVSGSCSDKKGKLTFTHPDGTRVYGADGCGERFAVEFNLPIKTFPADWNKGRSAGPIRNKAMGKYATHALGFPGGKGTKSMTEIADDCGLVLKEVKA